MTTRVLLIRHGATVLSAEDRFAGSTDVLLSDEGRSQARALGERLADAELAAVYASPMKRTVETASLVAAPHKLSLITDPGLREIDLGRHPAVGGITLPRPAFGAATMAGASVSHKPIVTTIEVT